MSTTDDPQVEPSLGELFGRLSEQTSRLVHAEIELAKAEMKARAIRLGAGAGLLAAAGVLALYALDKLFDAAALGLSDPMPPWLGFLLVGVVLLVIVAILGLVGVRLLKAATPPAPSRAAANVKDDVEALKKGLGR